MSEKVFYDQVASIVKVEPRYAFDGYLFIHDAVIHTIDRLKLDNNEEPSHITGQQLLKSVKLLAIERFGPLAYDVFSEWHIRDGGDVGNIVFTMVKHNLLTCTENDSLEDFQDNSSFKTILTEPFLPVRREDLQPPVIA